MKKHKYLKISENKLQTFINKFKASVLKLNALKNLCKKKICIGGVTFATALLTLLIFKSTIGAVITPDDSTFSFESIPIAAASGQRTTITVPSGTIKANPFLPYKEIDLSQKVINVPSELLAEPPEVVDTDSDGARIMYTVVSGILYDKFSPSAILNIEGSDYLVKKNDEVNNYKVLNITKDSVTVKLGNNTYKAGIGEILTEGTVNPNKESNLDNKFGGRK